MARDMTPILKRCKALGLHPAVMGISKTSKRAPKQTRKKQSEYGLQLVEKQKVKFVYGVLEKQFRIYFKKAAKAKGITGEVLLQLLELRLDNVVFRLGFANTRREARQLVNHGHFMINGKKVDIVSYSVNVGDVIAIRDKSRKSEKFKAIIEENGANATKPWLSRETDSYEGTVVSLPQRDDIDFDVEEHLIVELYSR